MKVARKIDITCCTRIGKYQLNQPRPISVTFNQKEDRQKLLENKRNLPNGIFINEEFPPPYEKKLRYPLTNFKISEESTTT